MQHTINEFETRQSKIGEANQTVLRDEDIVGLQVTVHHTLSDIQTHLKAGEKQK
jgi:hypothetical protein